MEIVLRSESRIYDLHKHEDIKILKQINNIVKKINSRFYVGLQLPANLILREVTV